MTLTNTSNAKTLTSLALMETQVITKDYMSTFLPFLGTLILKKNYAYVDIGAVVRDFKQEYGISIPRAPMQSILAKAVSNGLITRTTDGKYLPVLSEIQKISFLSIQGEINIKIEIVINRFLEFAKNNHNIILTQSDAIDILIDFFDEYSPRAVSGKYINNEVDKIVSSKNLYLIGEFIQQTIHSDVSLFETIQKLAMSYLITTALTFDEPVDTRISEFSEMVIYLDTPIILRLLGLQTEELEDAYKEMFSNFKTTINPTFKIFQHTLDEITGIISDCANWIDNADYNPAYANFALLNFVKRKFSKTQIELYRNTLEDKLAELNIDVDYDEYYNIVHKNAQIDVTVLQQKLIETYQKNRSGYVYEKNKTSVDYDIKSIENIVKLWGTKTSASYSKLGYLFITTNSTLAYVCRKFTSEYWWNSKNHKTPCVTDYYLGTMVWLSTPAEKIESVSKLKLIADCSAATTLSREIMEKFSQELEKLKLNKGIDSSDYLLIRKYAYEQNYLQKLTLNEETAFKDDILEQLLEDIKADIKKPLIETINEKDTQISTLKEENSEIGTRIKSLETEKQTLALQKTIENEHIEKQADKTAKLIINTYAPIVFALFAFIAVILKILPDFSSVNIFITIGAAIIALGAAFFFGIMKSDLFKAHTNMITKLRKYYSVKNYKQNLK